MMMSVCAAPTPADNNNQLTTNKLHNYFCLILPHREFDQEGSKILDVDVDVDLDLDMQIF